MTSKISETRFSICRFDESTYQVVDGFARSEFCVCSDFEDSPSAKVRAQAIADSLNATWNLDRAMLFRGVTFKVKPD
jgi:hypothetical protein